MQNPPTPSRQSSNFMVAKLPGSDKTRANTDLRFTWGRQEDFDTRVGLIRDHLGRAYGKDITVQVVRYAGSETVLPLVLTCSPLEALAYAGKQVNAADYCAVSIPHLVAHADLKQSDWIRVKLKSRNVRLEESATRSWGRLPLQPHGKEVVTLWELPANPATFFYEENSDELWSLAPSQAVPHVAAANCYPGELVSWSVLLAGEQHLKDQILAGTAPFSNLIGAQVRGGSGTWTSVPCYCEFEGGLWLSADWYEGTDSSYGSCAFLPGVA